MKADTPQESPATGLQLSHDDVYKAVFDLVGQKPTETYEDLTKVLPSIKDSDPAELKELAAKKALHELLNPPKDPLRVEYEAAAEDEVDDLSTEEGEWLDENKGKAIGEDGEELDEHGIPVMKLSRASSSFILDGPGDVKVDNFTPEADGEDPRDQVGTSSNISPSGALTAGADHRAASAAAAVATAGLAGMGSSGYVPSTILRAGATPGGAARAAAGAAAGAAGSGSAAAPTPAPAPVLTLEDEIRAMRGGAGAVAASGSPRLNYHRQQQQLQQQLNGTNQESGRGAQDAEDEDAPEVVLEPQAAMMPLPTGGGGAAPSSSSSSNSRRALLRGAEAADDGEAAATAAAALAGASRMMDPDDGTSLPGACQDTSHEDALWASLQEVDGRALVEHMGLAGPADLKEDDSGLGEEAASSASPSRQQLQAIPPSAGTDGSAGSGPGAAHTGRHTPAGTNAGGIAGPVPRPPGAQATEAAMVTAAAAVAMPLANGHVNGVAEDGPDSTSSSGSRGTGATRSGGGDAAEPPIAGPAADAAVPQQPASVEIAASPTAPAGPTEEAPSTPPSTPPSDEPTALAATADAVTAEHPPLQPTASQPRTTAAAATATAPADVAQAPAATSATAAAAPDAAAAEASPPGRPTVAAATATQAAEGAGAGAIVLAAASRAAPAGTESAGGPEAASSGPGSDGPTIEAVEPFRLDPDFDYDNVQLTPREFPYSLLNTRWAAGFGAAPNPNRR